MDDRVPLEEYPPAARPDGWPLSGVSPAPPPSPPRNASRRTCDDGRRRVPQRESFLRASNSRSTPEGSAPPSSRSVAAFREYVVDGRPVLDPYAADRIRDGAHGAPLIPWPNRLEDGRYSFDGTTHQVPLTEPEKERHPRVRPLAAVGGNRTRCRSRRDDDAPLSARGLPSTLGIRISYELGPKGLTVAATAQNLGDRACPYGHGQHPYLSPGSGYIDASARCS